LGATDVTPASASVANHTPAEKKKKIEKDPNAPKRNLSSYMLYSQAVRPATVAAHPDLKAVDIAKLIGEKWNALSDKEKQPYVKMAEKEKARFDKETKHYKATLGESDDSTPAKRKAEVVAEPEPTPTIITPSSKKEKKAKKTKHEEESSSKKSHKKK
jgi:hypothetical protein